MELELRAVRAEDRVAWWRLWQGYLDFSGSQLDPQISEHTWQRLLDPASPFVGRVAARDAEVLGFSVSVLHPGSWSLSPHWYLEDLFVAPGSRGGGVGGALMDDAIAQARAQGCGRIYWHTGVGNAQARRLYDAHVLADDVVRYRLPLG